MGQIYSQVQYPTSRPINTIAFQSQPQAQPSAQMGGQNSSKFNPNQRVFSGTGHVTKVQNDFGFIDEEVFFHKNVCKGAFPKVGDRVLVEAAYNQNMPFKWNATRVQVLQSAASSSGVSNSSSSRHSMGGGGGGGGYNSSQQMSSGRNRYSPTRKSPDRHGGHRSSNHDSRQRDIDDEDRRRRRDDRDGDRYRDKHRDRTPERERRERERSPVRKQSPKRRKTRPIPRYMVQMPKQLLTQTRVDILELRRRYLTLYIPSDFFTSEVRWTEAFPPNEPFSINNPCAFHVMHKEVEPLVPMSANDLEPVDADYLYSAKVMLMATPPMAEFYQKCFATAEDRDRYEDLVHPTRLISFLVGIRGKSETMAIGGPWSPSLDGENPQSDPNVLIKTAIRTCKGLTGIDLSNCTRWYRFVELYYRRSETYDRKGRLVPARIETVVIFLPDIRSCQPTRPEWDELHLSYKSHLERIINSQSSDSPVPPAAAVAAAAAAGEPTDKPIDSATSSTSDSVKPAAAAAEPAAEPAAAVEKTPVVEGTDPADPAAAPKDPAEDDKADVVEVTEKEVLEVVVLDDDDDEEENEPKKEPTHYKELDVKKLKVTELRTELQARDLPTDGVKNVLVTRLTKALKQEQEEAEKKEASETAPDETKSESKPAADEETPAEEEKKPADEKPAEKDSDDVVEVSVKPVEKEAEEDFETMDNVDMSEVTVIDEYDSKADEKTKPEPVKLTEKERQLLEKRYSLPEQPHIIVHPSRTAKSGKFDCAVMSLSVLLDYRPEDSKEHSFEVSLFAELFNEMLTRDFGFNIYKALHMLPAKKDEEKKEKEVTIDLDAVDEKKVNGDGAKEKEEDTAKSTSDKEEKDKSKERDTRKRSRFDDPTEDDKRRREKEKERTKFYTADRELLLSFTYFDVSHCGYIFDKDIEDLFYTIGLHLSRSQIRRLVSKAVTRDSLYYRKLTDKVKEDDDVVEISDEKSPEKEEKDAEKPDSTETTEADAEKKEVVEKIEAATKEEIPEAELKEIATGNSNYKEQLKANLQLVLNTDASDDDKPPAKKMKLDPTATENDVSETESGIVVHNGGVVNIPKLLEQMRRLEKSREEAELLLVDLRKQNTELSRSNARANEKIKDQGTDLKNTTKKLAETEQNLREITRKYNEYYSTVSNIYDRVSLVLNRTESTSKRSSSITSSKRGSSRDRTSRKDTKPKDKEADPGKTKDNNGAEAAAKPSEKKSDESSDVEVVVAGSDSKESVETMDVDVSATTEESAKKADDKEDAPKEAKEGEKKE
uniref:Putative cell division cycle and apoptosis regulator protein 1 n=1 Tax=Culex tarsalis TaxID=7177 RepID=A0A1Q3F266_CULTA